MAEDLDTFEQTDAMAKLPRGWLGAASVAVRPQPREIVPGGLTAANFTAPAAGSISITR